MTNKLAGRISQINYQSIDTSFCFVQDLSTEDEEEKEEKDDDKECPNGSAFIVNWSCLLMLLNGCLNCVAPTFI